MPPQPLGKVKSGANYLMIGGFAERPEVANGIARCLANWSWVETMTSYIFLKLLGTNHKAAIALYNSFESAKGKTDAIRTLAISKLPAQELDLVKAALRLVKSHQSARDRIAHWLWGLSEDLPDAMVMLDPKLLLAKEAHLRENWLSGKGVAVSDFKHDEMDIYVYTAAALKKDAEDFASLARLIAQVGFFLDPHHKRPERDVLFAELTQDARLAQFLSPSSSAGRMQPF